MFKTLFLWLSMTIVSSIFLAAVVLDPLYLSAIKQDELAYTRGINQVVSEDIQKVADKQSRLDYWADRFSYQFSLATLAEIELAEHAREDLKKSAVYVDVISGWAVDDITIYYYQHACQCYLVMRKNYGSHGYFQKYVLSFLAIVILSLGIFILYYGYYHQRQVKQLVSAHVAYGKGQFSCRANTQLSEPYAVLANTFNQMASRIESLLTEQRTLVHGVSHDLKTPIARLRFLLDMSRECGSVEQYQTQLQEMDIDLDELYQLVDEWLFYAQINSTPFSIETQKTALVPLIKQSLKRLAPLYRHITYESSLQACDAFVDAHLFMRALDNLLLNAFKFAETKIAISLTETEQGIMLVIDDDGAGIADDLQQDILLPFVKLDKSRNSHGFGLGLAIVKSIADKHHAKVAVANSPLGGASFSLLFPTL